jgi:alginate export protein
MPPAKPRNASCIRAALGYVAAFISISASAQFDNAPSPAQPANPFDEATTNPAHEEGASKILQGPLRALLRRPLPESDTEAGVAQTQSTKSWPRVYRDGRLLVTGSLTGAAAVFSMSGNEFDKPVSLATPGYKANPNWGEGFIEPGISARYSLGSGASMYGGYSWMGTATRGTDNGGNGNTWHGDNEELYGGLKWRDASSGFAIDASYGQQDFEVGKGMLLQKGASNGPQRGANELGPRAAWANAALLTASYQDFKLQGFWLKPNESTSAETGTRLTGANLEWNPAGPVRLGAMWIHVPDSEIVTRDGLNVYDLRARVHPIATAPNLWFEADYAWQRKDNVAADGWLLQANYNAKDMPWKPLFDLRYAALSGDKPGTAKWEGFDPLYFGGSNPNWYQGQIGSTIFGNTNLDVASAGVTLTPDEKNIVILRYLYFSAAQINSPLSIPAPGEPPPTGGGVPSKALANEFDFSWTYTIDKALNVNGFVSYASPGSGYKDLYAANGGSASGWWFLGVQFNFSY